MRLIESLECRRLLSAGLLDTSFGTGGKATADISGRADLGYGVVVAPDGTIYVGGSSENSNAPTDQSDFALARFTSTGVLSSTVRTDFSGGQDFAYAVGRQSTGKVVLAGVAYSADLTSSDFALARYKTDGSLDTAFGTNGKVTTSISVFDSISGIAIEAGTDKIIVVGSVTAGGAFPTQLGVARYTSEGVLDNTFGVGGVVSGPSLPKGTAVAIATDGSLYITGNDGQHFVLMHLSDTGVVDGAFGTNGVVTTPISNSATAYALVIQTDGPTDKIVLAGEATPPASLNAKMAFARYNANGTLDNTFGTAGITTVEITGSIDQALSLVQQADGKLIAAGFAAGSGSGDFATVRLSSDGQLDPTWGRAGIGVTDINGAQDNAHAAVIDAQGRLVVAGQGTTSGNVNMAVARYTLGNSDQIGIFRDGVWGLDSDSNRGWNVGSDAVLTFGQAGDIPVTGDWNGDGVTDVGVFRDGLWILDSNGTPGLQDDDLVFGFGLAGWTPIVGDWNGDGIDDVGVYNGAQWALDSDGNHAWSPGVDEILTFGDPSFVPVVGDWNGDGKTDIGVWANGAWGLDSDGVRGWNPGSDASFAFGSAGMTPVIGDWNGDGKSDVGVFSGGMWGLDSDGVRGWSGGDAVFAFGIAGWTPIVGDWNGDGKSDVGIFSGARWGLDTDGIRGWTVGDNSFAFGLADDEPVAGAW